MTERANNLSTKKLGLCIFWIASGLVVMKTGNVAFLIPVIIFSDQHNKKISEIQGRY